MAEMTPEQLSVLRELNPKWAFLARASPYGLYVSNGGEMDEMYVRASGEVDASVAPWRYEVFLMFPGQFTEVSE